MRIYTVASAFPYEGSVVETPYTKSPEKALKLLDEVAGKYAMEEGYAAIERLMPENWIVDVQDDNAWNVATPRISFQYRTFFIMVHNLEDEE